MAVRHEVAEALVAIAEAGKAVEAMVARVKSIRVDHRTTREELAALAYALRKVWMRSDAQIAELGLPRPARI